MQQQKWFITGISSGLGAALAREVMERGDFAIGTFRQAEQAAAFNAAHAGRGYAYVLDVTDQAAITSVTQRVLEEQRDVAVLVNNAGIGFAGAIEETSPAESRRLMEVNFFGALEVTRAFLPHFRRRGGGRIIQISSHGGIKAFPGFGLYNAGKFALEGFSEALAQEVAPLGIHVTLVEPGPFRTQFAGAGFGLAKTKIADYAATAGSFRSKIKAVDGKQEGDPARAATAIVDLSRRENPPLRLVLGKTALVTIGMKIDSLKMDLEASREVAEGVVFGA